MEVYMAKKINLNHEINASDFGHFSMKKDSLPLLDYL